MDAKTLEALKASIAKWRRNARVRGPDNYLTAPHDCPLCALFHGNDCEGCPVRDKTGLHLCYDTPYERADHWSDVWFNTGELEAGRRARAAAREEVAFLESLLPEEAKE